jgi:hypothetical protein
MPREAEDKFARAGIQGELDSKPGGGAFAHEKNRRHSHGRQEVVGRTQEADSMGMANIPPVGGTAAGSRGPLQGVRRLADLMRLAMCHQH